MGTVLPLTRRGLRAVEDVAMQQLDAVHAKKRGSISGFA